MSGRPSRRFRVDIQGLRAVAVVLVIIDHAHFGLRGGFIGVDVFFVISGFVITAMLLREVQSEGRIRLGRFFIRRGYRLIPAAIVVIVFTALVGMLLLSPLGTQQQAAVTGGAAAVGLSNIALYAISSDYFSEHTQSNPYLHTWSLGVEEQFYLFFPLALLLVWKVAEHLKRAAAVVLTIVAVVSFALSLIASYSAVLPIVKSPSIFAFYMMPTRAWEFAVGALIACGAVWLTKLRGHAFATWAGLSLIMLGAVFIDNSVPFPGIVAVVPVLGAAFVIFGGLASNRGSQMLAWRPFAHIGDLSYSLYLWHWPLLVFARRIWPDSVAAVVAALVLTYVAAFLTYRYVETPFRGKAQTWSWRTVRMPAVAVSVALLAAGSMFVGAQSNWGNKNVEAAADQLLERPTGYSQCLSTTPVAQRDLSPCTWEGEGKPIYLVGDSNAQQFTEALISASETLDRPLIIATWGGCPFFDVGRVDLNDPNKGAECSAYAAGGEEWLAQQPAGTVIMAAAGEMITDSGIVFRSGEGILDDPASKAAQWGEAMAARIADLEVAGHEVLVVPTLPHFVGISRAWWHPVQCQNADLFADPSLCSARVSTSDMQESMAAISKGDRYGITTSGAEEIDLTGQVCESGWCETYRDGTWLYRDGLHISPTYSEEIAGVFVDALR
ncbi:acyltransferase [Microbacterium sp. LTA6]|uniref:acyltransferase family protein n=1 Tax=Microbacterium sp. LTA6 TaxID=3129771 RepID=UPI003243B94B